MAVVLWFLGFLGLLVATLVASARARAMPSDIVGRRVIAAAAVAYVGIVLAAVWTWGGATAAAGRSAQLQGGALVHLALDGVRLPLPPSAGAIAIGHGPDAAIRIPGDAPGAIDGAGAGSAAGVVARIEPAAGGGAVVHGGVVAAVHGGDAALVATARGCAVADAAYSLPVGSAVAVIECAAGKPLRAFVVHSAGPGELAIAPLAWRGRFVAEQLTARAGDALRIGGGDESIAGLTTWDVIAPHGAAAMLAIPADPTECAAWLPEAAGRARAIDGGCALDAGAFRVAAVPLVPDADRVVDRGLRAALAIGAPPLVLLVVLGLAARRDRRVRSIGRALRLCVLGAALTALCGWRLLWAYRIDMLRELASAGPRLVENQLSVIAVGAALAGNAVLAHESLAAASPGRRAFAAVLAWMAWLAIAALVVAGTDGPPPLTAARAGVLALSLAGALAPVAGELASRAAACLPPELGLVAISAAAIGGKLAAPRSALVKLGLAYALVLAAHVALRRMMSRDTALVRRCAGAVLLGAAVLALARYDTGVTLAIVGIGLSLAVLVAGHDAAYDASQAARIGVLEREHARLLAAHGAAAIALGLGVAACAVWATDRELVASGAAFVVHAPLAVAGLFAMAAAIARSHRRGWVPWLCAALAALAVWTARDAIVERATGGDNVGSRRIAAVLDPGYAVLRDQRTYVANASAWREAALPRVGAGEPDRWSGEGYFGARVRDLGVSRSIDNDYLPVLVARETGIAGLTQTIGLLLAIAVGAGAIASLRLRHASRQHRARWLVTAVIGGLALYQPLAALGVLPLTGISWPGLGIDSPADLWLFALGAIWCLACGEDVDGATDDERVRRTARLARARAIALGALGITALAAVVLVARAGSAALGRVAAEDERIDAALRYAATIACPWPSRDGAALDDVVPPGVPGTPRDDATARFDRELAAAWTRDRPLLLATLPTCGARAGRWTLVRDGDGCVATLRAGVPTVRLRTERTAAGVRGTCGVALSQDLIAALRAPVRAVRAARIRVVGQAMGAAAGDVGELVAGSRVIRIRPGAPAVELAALATGSTAASRVAIAGDVALDIRAAPRGAMLHGGAELFVAEPGQPAVWRRMAHGADVLLDRVTLIAAGPAEHRRVALFRPPREWPGSPPAVDTLLADDTASVGERARRVYPHGAALPELGWVNPFDVERSLGLDGWIHAALAHPPTSSTGAAAGPACGTLAPVAIARDRVCSPSPLDGVTECRVALQPELAARLRAIADRAIADPRPHTGRDTTPVRVAYVVLRGDTGELLAQASIVPGRAPMAYAPADAAAEAQLIKLRESRGESDAERVEWNLPIAVGSTFKPIIARAAEQAFPQALATLSLTADGHATGCKAHRGTAVDPLLGHCPPTSLAEAPSSADLHDYLARSLNWYQAALGVIGLGLPAGSFTVKGEAVQLADIAASDLATWPPSSPLQVADAAGAIVEGHHVAIAGLRRTPLWSRVEALLGRPLCTLGDRARCEAAAERADVCAARALPIAAPGRDLRYLVALGPDRLDLYADDRPAQAQVPIREYFQLLRGSGVHSVGSLAQLTDAFGRVIYDPTPDAPRLAASWFPAPATGTAPAWSCARAEPAGGRANTVLGADGGLCAVVQATGTAHAQIAELLSDPKLVVYGAKTGTTDSLADIAHRDAACHAWNERHPPATQLTCGKTPPDDSLFVIAFGVVTAHGTVPITLGVQLQRGGKTSAAHVTPELVHAIADYLR